MTPRVYVDPLVSWGPGAGSTAQARRISARTGGRWCHLMVEAGADLVYLHAFAARLGLYRAWFQDHPPHPHYDLTPSRRALAVRLGALEVSGEEQTRLCRRATAERTPS